MQIQTTTITTETQAALGANFQITTNEQKVTAFCDCCPKTGTGMEKELTRRGWHLGRTQQFCPVCNL